MAYNKLFEKGKIGKLTIKNRGVMMPMGTVFSEPDGSVNERIIEYYAERAKGGIGLIINEYTGVDDVDSIPTTRNLRASRHYHVAGLERLVEAVHKYDCLIFAQLHHGGATSKPALTGRQSLSASNVPAAPGAPEPRPMTVEEIKAVEKKFIDAAVRCKMAGYDGVELHGAHSYLLAEFFSPYFNKRTDEYGGSLENRMRIIAEIIAGIRKELGNDFPISVRICGDEMTPGMLTLEEGLEIGKYLEGLGIDVINISNGSSQNGNANCDPYSYRPGWKKHVAKAFKETLNIPVIATNTIKNPDFAEQMLEEGVCDFVGLGRSQFADPEFMKKAKEGRPDEIRQCIGCMFCRERLIPMDLPVMCSVNPRLGCEYIYKEYKKNGNGRPAAVIGGGPAGMEAARVLAERGFDVTLFEKEGFLGGALNVADKPKFKDCIDTLTRTMETQIRKLGVKTVLGVEATPETVKKLNPVVVFVACGAKPVVPNIEGVDGKNVAVADDIITGKVKAGKKAAIIGTGLTALEAAETMLEQGVEVTIIGRSEKVGRGVFPVILNDVLSRVNSYKPEYMFNQNTNKITENGVVVTDKATGEEKLVEADTVVLAIGITPKNDIVEAFEKEFDNVIAIGDALKGGRIHNATKDGFTKAFAFDD